MSDHRICLFETSEEEQASLKAADWMTIIIRLVRQDGKRPADWWSHADCF